MYAGECLLIEILSQSVNMFNLVFLTESVTFQVTTSCDQLKADLTTYF